MPSTRGREVSRPLDELVAEARAARAATASARSRCSARTSTPTAATCATGPVHVRRAPARDRCDRRHRSRPLHVAAPQGHARGRDPRPRRAASRSASTSTCRCSRAPRRSCKAMRRTYDRERYLDRVALIREHVPDCALTTDIIVGFPGETEADFEQTLEVVDEVGFDGAFTFVFSPRRGTEAERITEGVVPHPVKVAAHRAARRARPDARPRARSALRRPHGRRARRGPVAHRSRPPARPLPPQQGRQLLRPRPAGRDRAGHDRRGDEPDAVRRAVAGRPRGNIRLACTRKFRCITSPGLSGWTVDLDRSTSRGALVPTTCACPAVMCRQHGWPSQSSPRAAHRAGRGPGDDVLRRPDRQAARASQVQKGSVQSALDAAAADLPGPNTVELGPGTFDAAGQRVRLLRRAERPRSRSTAPGRARHDPRRRRRRRVRPAPRRQPARRSLTSRRGAHPDDRRLDPRRRRRSARGVTVTGAGTLGATDGVAAQRRRARSPAAPSRCPISSHADIEPGLGRDRHRARRAPQRPDRPDDGRRRPPQRSRPAT